MRLPIRSTPPSAAMNMTPMIDVVFLLIIFFLVSSHLAKQETQMELDLPSAGLADRADESPERRVTINVLPDGQTFLGGERADARTLADRLAFEQQQSETPLRVRIRGDRSAAYRAIEPVLVACAEAGVWDVNFAVYSSSAVGGGD
ncbi:MAG: biopolymer transporter ExbD [Planctomycetota bacterium]